VSSNFWPAPAVVAVIAALTLSGCSVFGADDDFTVSDALEELPYAESDGLITVEVGDLDRATELADREPPEPGDSDAAVEWLRGFDGAVFVPFPALLGINYLATGQGREQVGLDATEVSTFAGVSAAETRFVVEELREGAHLKDGLPERDGVRQTSEGEIGEFDPNSADTGDGPYVFVTAVEEKDGQVAFANQAAAVSDWKDGDGDRLSDHEALAAVAEALDEADPYAAILVAGDLNLGLSPRTSPAEAAQTECPISEEFDAVGVGQASEDGSPRIFVSYHFTSASDSAEEQVEAAWTETTSAQTLRPISDLVKFEGVESDGDVITAELTPVDDRADVVYRMLIARDLPLAHC
jgi:hypothetical protein